MLLVVIKCYKSFPSCVLLLKVFSKGKCSILRFMSLMSGEYINIVVNISARLEFGHKKCEI